MDLESPREFFGNSNLGKLMNVKRAEIGEEIEARELPAWRYDVSIF